MIYASVKRASQTLVTAALALGMTGLSPATVAAQLCGDGEPAIPVPEFRNGTRVWSNDLQPAKPGQQLPLDRDSTQYTSFGTFPTWRFGHEIFQSIDIVDDRLYMAYGGGFQYWSLAGANVDDPDRIDVRDGEQGHFLRFGTFGESDTFIYEIAAIDPAGGSTIDDYIGVAGEGGTGFSLWENRNGTIVQLYQNDGDDSRNVRLIEFTDSLSQQRVYAFSATDEGVVVYDVDTAKALGSPCLDDVDIPGAQCPGVRRGTIDNSTLRTRYTDVIEKNGKIYAAVSDGTFSQPIKLQIWEIPNPSVPQTAFLRFDGSGLSSDVRDIRGLEFFTWNGVDYLAYIRQGKAQIFNIGNCIDANGCTSLGSPVWEATLPTWPGEGQFLTYSESSGKPFLYYSLTTDFISGGAVEQLFDLSTLGTTNQVVEITGGGGTYVDACNGKIVDYWGDYYGRNDHGLRNVAPRSGQFAGAYFYRAARGIFDVHVRPNVAVSPTITTRANVLPPYWFGDPISFTAEAENCASTGPWTWFATDNLATGLGAGSQTQNITWLLCGNPDSCPDKQIEVRALNGDCNTPDLEENPANVTVRDPRPRVQSLDVSPLASPLTYERCTELSFNGNLSGRPPFTYAWEVRDQNGQTVNLPGTTTNPFVWDTTNVNLAVSEVVFEDFFETGNTNTWTTPAPPPGGAAFTVELTASNGVVPASPDTDSVQVNIVPLATLGFTTPGITAQNLGAGQYRFTANFTGATELRWEVEDPANGSSTGCNQFASCVVFDFGEEDGVLDYTWVAPNQDGNYRVAVWLSQCDEHETTPLSSLPSSSTTVSVSGIVAPDPPTVTRFEVDEVATGAVCDCDPFSCFCTQSSLVRFNVTFTGTATTLEFDWDENGTFEETFNVGDPISHAFTSTGSASPLVRARQGSQISSPRPLDTDVQIIP